MCVGVGQKILVRIVYDRATFVTALVLAQALFSRERLSEGFF
jgi:hypothetical protein